MTQWEKVIDYIGRFGSITPLDAFRDLGITRLAAVIWQLRKDGIVVYGEMEKSKNRFGEPVKYMRYSLERRNEND